MKFVTRAVVFAIGAALLFFGWHKAHGDLLNLQNAGATNSISSSRCW